VNSLNPTTVNRQSGSVHPGPLGAGQMGEKLWALLKNI
jgi:hypothetical protein